jgi:anti-sigma factor RsiW
MKHEDCLKDEELILHVYGELADDNTRQLHLAGCPFCAKRLASITHDLERLPPLAYKPDDFAATRMAARVSESIKQPKRSKLIPAIGVAVTASLVMIMPFMISPQAPVNQLAQSGPASTTNITIEESLPDIDFFEDIELLQDLDLLTQIEGV